MKKQPFGGTLTNPGGYLLATDTESQGGGLFAVGPESYKGDLSGFLGLRWDEFVYVRGAGGSRTVKPTELFITGGEHGTTYRLASNPLTEMGHWHPRLVEFKAGNFSLVSGPESFKEVLRRVSELSLSLDTSTMADGPESAIDNVKLVEKPSNLGIAMVEGGRLKMVWRGEPGEVYHLESSDSPGNAWQTVATIVADDDGRMNYECDKPLNPTAFYRLAYP